MRTNLSPSGTNRERGQAIVLIAMMMVVLMAFLALAVDGGNAYLHRRQAQNASDAGSIAGAALMLEAGITDGDILTAMYAKALENGLDPNDAAQGVEVHAWYIDVYGVRISDDEIGSWGSPPVDQGAAGVELTVSSTFPSFIAQLIGQDELSADGNSGAVVIFPTFCADWVFYANCDEGQGNCRNSALNISGSLTDVSGGGVHSNSGLHTTGSTFSLNPQNAEYGTPGTCTGNVCAPPYNAQQVPPQPMPEIYQWEDFQPGGFWWNDMCQGDEGDKCNTFDSDIRANDTISGGLWVGTGGIFSPRIYNPGQTHYTFVTSGDIHFSGSGIPIFEPFEGSSTTGGSKAFIYSTAQDPRGVTINGTNVNWKGMIYVPFGLTSISASGTQSGNGSIFSWRIDLSGSNFNVQHDTFYCPPEQARVTLLW